MGLRAARSEHTALGTARTACFIVKSIAEKQRSRCNSWATVTGRIRRVRRLQQREVFSKERPSDPVRSRGLFAMMANFARKLL